MMITQNRIKTVLTLAAVAMVFLVLPAAADIPDPLPDPDTTPPDTTKPVKVFILAGQSNMIGMGNISGDQPGTLETITTDGMFPHLVDAAGAWTVRNDVYYYEARINFTGGPLTIGLGNSATTIGPELQFGHIMGYAHDEQVLLIKTAMGNRCLAWDFRPPSSGQDDPNTSEYEWYAGWEYNLMIEGVNDTLTNIATILPDYQGQGYEIAGFGWFQGHKDTGNGDWTAEYEWNLVNLINDVRTDFGVENLPVVIATVGFSGWAMSGNTLTVLNAQMAVSDPVKYPAFAGNVMSVDIRDFWREVEESPANQGYHYNRNAETFMLVGDALGRAMAEILTPYSVDAGDNWVTWSGEPVELDATVQDGVTVVSYAWSAEPNDGVVFSDETVEDPNVTITKAAGDAVTVRLTLTVNDEENPPVRDIMTIDVYDTACKAAIGKGLAADNPADFDGNCITNFEDLAVMATKWLNDTGLTGPVVK
ncbi:MAG: hypothetical protein KAV87_10740 [Desulfobacteraceae bacterium]|nr:hypothetical protein [Desulfobacteraceae bacterium]